MWISLIDKLLTLIYLCFTLLMPIVDELVACLFSLHSSSFNCLVFYVISNMQNVSPTCGLWHFFVISCLLNNLCILVFLKIPIMLFIFWTCTMVSVAHQSFAYWLFEDCYSRMQLWPQFLGCLILNKFWLISSHQFRT